MISAPAQPRIAAAHLEENSRKGGISPIKYGGTMTASFGKFGENVNSPPIKPPYLIRLDDGGGATGVAGQEPLTKIGTN
jgi:hypothetical protein